MINLISKYYETLDWKVEILEHSIYHLYLESKDVTNTNRYVFVYDSFSIPIKIIQELNNKNIHNSIIELCIYTNGSIYHNFLKLNCNCTYTGDYLIFNKDSFIKLGTYADLYQSIVDKVFSYYKEINSQIRGIKHSNSYLYTNTAHFLYKSYDEKTYVHVDITIKTPTKIHDVTVFRFHNEDLQCWFNSEKNINLCVYNPSLDTLYIGNVKELFNLSYIKDNHEIYIPIDNFKSIKANLNKSNFFLLEKETELHNNLKEISQILEVPVIELAKVLLTKCNTRTYTLHLLTNIISKER